jgi:dihydroxyacetone kinase
VNCEVLDLRNCVVEAFVLPACDAASLGDFFVTFQYNYVASVLKVEMFMENEAEVDISVAISIIEDEIS